MDAADVVLGVTARLGPDDAGAVMAAVTSIYEACTFQDITGQRVTKVVNMLKVIEARVDKMVAAMSEGGLAAVSRDIQPQAGGLSSQTDIDALFGPAESAPANNSTLHGQSQDEIDALFSNPG